MDEVISVIYRSSYVELRLKTENLTARSITVQVSCRLGVVTTPSCLLSRINSYSRVLVEMNSHNMGGVLCKRFFGLCSY